MTLHESAVVRYCSAYSSPRRTPGSNELLSPTHNTTSPLTLVVEIAYIGVILDMLPESPLQESNHYIARTHSLVGLIDWLAA
jgi:hypothetical protein